jgi:hypothetical protein
MRSKYVSKSVEVDVGESALTLAKKYQPIVYDPFDFGKNPSPELYSRVLKKRKTLCIQYYYFWKQQKCVGRYQFTGRFTIGIFAGIISVILLYIISLVVSRVIGQSMFSLFFSNWVVYLFVFLFFTVIAGWKPASFIKTVGRFFGLFFGGFFTHDYDFEPVFIFVTDSRINKIVISGKGDVEARPHVTTIFKLWKGASFNEGFCEYKSNPRNYPNENEQKIFQSIGKDFFLEKGVTVKDVCKGVHPHLAILTCYHAFTADDKYNGMNLFTPEKKIDLEPQPLKDDIIENWFKTGHFGHDVSDPFKFPYIKFFSPSKFKKEGGREFALALLEGGGYIVRGIVTILRYLYRCLVRER